MRRKDPAHPLDLRARITPSHTSTPAGLTIEALNPKRRRDHPLRMYEDDQPGEWTFLRTDPFDARIREDGTVELSDRRFHHELQLRPGLQPGIELDVSPRRESSFAKERQPGMADVGADAPRALYTFGPDLNDEILRLFGDDPYAYEKRQFMEQTREVRLKMAIAACAERLDRAVLEVRDRLERIHEDPTTTPREQRRIMFDLWDECAESGDDQVLLVAAIVRATVIAFVRRHFPADGPLAFSPEELSALNDRRRSKARFVPYRRATGRAR